MGKYSAVIGDLPRMPVEDENYQFRVDQRKTELVKDGPIQVGDLAEEYEKIRLRIDEMKEQLSEQNLHLEAIKQLIEIAYEEHGITSLKLKNGTKVSIQYEPYAQVFDREAFREWCIAEGLTKSMYLHPSTAQSLVKNRLLDGDPEPPGVKTFVRSKFVKG